MAWRTARGSFLILLTVLVACGGSGELRWDDEDIDPAEVRNEARALGSLAACNDGTFDDGAEASVPCMERGGIERWLYPFAECHDGSFVKLVETDDSPCSGRDGFLRAADAPVQRPDDVALCNDGTFDDGAEESGTCTARGGIDQWLYPFAKCRDGSFVPLVETDDSPCASRRGLLDAVEAPVQRASDVALCNDGTFDNQKVLAENCAEQGGIDGFLAEYVECRGGFVVAATADGVGCDGAITRLIPDDLLSRAGPDDVALCNDGFFDDEDDLSDNCKKQGGIDRFLANHAECGNGRVILMSVEGIGCEGGIAHLLPWDYEPAPGPDDIVLCSDGLFDNEADHGENCKKQGGIDRFLAKYAECENGRVILLTVDGIRCEGAIARLLPTDFEPAPGPDDVVACKDGLFDNEAVLAENCKKQGGIDRFLAEYAECGSGEVIRMTTDAECTGGITLLPDDYVPPPPTTTAPTPRELLLGAVKSNEWGNVLNRTVRDRSLIVTVRSDAGLGAEKDIARYAVADVLERAQQSGGLSEVDWVEVVIRYPLQNQFGEVSEENVIEATFASSTIRRIVFENIDGRNILDVAEIGTVFTHPAIRY